MAELKKLLSQKELQKKLGGVTRDTLIEWREKEGMPYICPSGKKNGKKMYDPEAVALWLEKYKQGLWLNDKPAS